MMKVKTGLPLFAVDVHAAVHHGTGAGTLVVSGEGLHIGKLSLDGGELHVDGRIDALTYEDAPEERGGSFFSRLFA